MKKVVMGLLVGVCMFCISGCNSQMEQDIAGLENTFTEASEVKDESLSQFKTDFVSNRINLLEYRSLYEAEVNEIRGNNLGNISFSDCEIIPMQDVEKVGIYRLYSTDMGVDESIEIIKNWLNENGHENINLEHELRDASGQYEESNEEYPYCYPAVYDYYPQFDSGRGFFLNTNECYIQMGSDGIYSMSDGTITDFLELDTLAAMDALGVNEENVADKGNVTDKASDVWELTDGETSVGEAETLVENYFEQGVPRQNPTGIEVDVPYVLVFALNDKYGYAFNVRRIYNGVPFAYAGSEQRTYYNDSYEIVEDVKHAYVINCDKVAAFTGYSDAEQLEPLIEEQTEIMGLKDAAYLLNDFFADNVKLEIKKAGLVYCTYRDKKGNRIAYPCWQFEGTNATNAQAMRAYVNVLSGDVYYYSYVEG